MAKKRTLLRHVGRWALWLVIALLVLFAIQVALLAFPQPLMSQKVQSGSVIIYSDGPADPRIEALAADVNWRLQASGLYDSTRTARVFFFRNQGLYTVFARLAMVPPEAQGFAPSVTGNAFVSEANVTALGARTGGQPTFSVWEGSPAHTIAHELAHLCVTDQLGRSRWQALPHWKQEGLPEYMANIARIRADSLASLTERLRILQDDRAWSSTLGWTRHGWDRVHYKAGLLVEFLIEVEGYSISDIVADSVTDGRTLIDLATWTEAQKTSDPTSLPAP